MSNIKEVHVNQSCMSLSTYYLEYGRHVARLCRHRRRRRGRANAHTSNTASHDNNDKINSWVSFSFLYEYGAPLLPSFIIHQIFSLKRDLCKRAT